jgi:hypothetical protein
MSAIALLAKLQGEGVTIQKHGKRLSVEGASDILTPDVMEALRRNKAELLGLLEDPARIPVQVADAIMATGPAAATGSQVAVAKAVLSRTGVRIMALDDGQTVGIWSDLDSPDVRAAVETLGMEAWPVKYLDEPEIPARYKLRQIAGKPVPASVLLQMIRATSEPWARRDIMLAEMEQERTTDTRVRS